MNLHHKFGYDFIVSSDYDKVGDIELNSGFWFTTHKNEMLEKVLYWSYNGIPYDIFNENIDGSQQELLNLFGCKEILKTKRHRIDKLEIINDRHHEFESLKCEIFIDYSNSPRERMSWLYLNPDLFANGHPNLHDKYDATNPYPINMTLKRYTKSNNSIERYLVHGNWILRQRDKINRMKQSNLWLINNNNMECTRIPRKRI